MKKLKFNKFIAYASAFVSFVLPKIHGVKEIVVFGSVVRGEADKESDIDLFFDIEKKTDEKKFKKTINELIKKFYKSKIAEIWILKDVDNQINAKVGKLDDWKLKRSIISEGICLYSEYKEVPKGMKGFTYFYIKPIKKIKKRNKVIRMLFGRKEKNYNSKGIVEEFSGKKLSPANFFVPKEHAGDVVEFLGKEKISYKLFEFWTDQI